ncbi:MAG: DM13 domain-containing protein [Leptolyngbyaceae cyanobacterium MO_188.B28]|nr:DM13 domain-containing protein [Leptolyngbyaceae cyanobacterium MO_188.B28]
MRKRLMILLGVTGLLTVSPVTKLSANQNLSASASLKAISAGRLNTQVRLKSGSFIGVAHSTSGTATIFKQDDQRRLELGNNFSTDSGPDLFVLLHRSSNPESYRSEDYLSLGRLQQIRGSQRYLIPADANLENYNSVVIWCRRFNVTFGYATLSG